MQSLVLALALVSQQPAVTYRSTVTVTESQVAAPVRQTYVVPMWSGPVAYPVVGVPGVVYEEEIVTADSVETRRQYIQPAAPVVYMKRGILGRYRVVR